MTISVSGLVSGIDYDSLVTQLMEVESQPLTTLATKEASYQTQLTAYGTLKGALSDFQTTMASLAGASKYNSLNATNSNTSVATVSAATSAKVGRYSLEVTQLAQAQKLVATGQSSVTAEIGSGTLTFDFGTISGGTLDDETGQYTGSSFTSSGSGIKTITIDESNNSLSGIRDAINKANIGVTATIINDGSDTPYRLALSVENSGEENSLKISVNGDDALSSLLSQDPAGTQGLTQTVAAQNAEFEVDGISISKSSNIVTDVISGVTMSLLETNTGSQSVIAVTRDTDSITSAVNSFVEAYNAIAQTLSDSMAYNADTETAAILNGESSVRTVQTQLRSILSNALTGTGTISMLSQVGVSLQKDGTLAVDDDELLTALADNPESFAGLFAAAGSTTDSLITYSGSSSKTQAGSYEVNITQLATQGSAVASGAAGLNIIEGINDTFQVSLDGNTASITLSAKTYSNADELASEIQSQINGASVFSSAGSSVKVRAAVDGTLTITSDIYGSTSGVSIIGGNGQNNLMLGSAATVTTGMDVAGTIGGIEATGSGQKLIVTAGGAAGISLTITGGGTGSRGTIDFSLGYAHQFNTLVTSLLDDDGPIETRIDGINASIEDIGKQEERISARMVTIEARYRTQFNKLELLLSTLTSTSNYLTQQLEAISNLNTQISNS